MDNIYKQLFKDFGESPKAGKSWRDVKFSKRGTALDEIIHIYKPFI